MFAFNNRRSYSTEAFELHALFIQGQVIDVCKLQHKHKSLHPQLEQPLRRSYVIMILIVCRIGKQFRYIMYVDTSPT